MKNKIITFVFLLSSLNIFSQEKIIHGIVLDKETNELLSGVSISNNDTTIYSNFDGLFNVQTNDTNLFVNYISYQPTIIKINNYKYNDIFIAIYLQQNSTNSSIGQHCLINPYAKHPKIASPK